MVDIIYSVRYTKYRDTILDTNKFRKTTRKGSGYMFMNTIMTMMADAKSGEPTRLKDVLCFVGLVLCVFATCVVESL